MSWTAKKRAEGTLLVLVVFLVVVASVNAAAAWVSCSWYGYQTQRDTRYAFGVGCMVRAKDHWVPRSELRTEQ